ncbi:hypothetical protein BCE02nite_61340 [Brevibacillus centrosporus]|nr:hypothetical protein BCE02nite_61340 [Brevibacillus centrosporus]
MGVLVEEAKKHGVFLEFSHALGGGYYGLAGCFEDGEYIILHNSSEARSTAPYAACLIFLEAM